MERQGRLRTWWLGTKWSKNKLGQRDPKEKTESQDATAERYHSSETQESIPIGPGFLDRRCEVSLQFQSG